MWVKPVKAISKYLRTFIFLLLLLKGAFPLKAAYALSTNGCAMQPGCLAMLKAELGTTIAAPSAVPAGVSLVARFGTAGIVLLWEQPLTEYAQVMARERYCTANPNDSVCVPFKGGQCQGMRYVIHVEYSYNHYQGTSVARTGWDDFFGPIEGIVDTNGTGSGYANLFLRGRSYQDQIYERFLIHAPYSDLNYCKIVSLKPLYSNQIDNCGNPPPSPWKDWPQAKRKAAVDSLTNSDWQDFTDSMKDDGLRLQNEPINGPIIVIEGQETDDLNTPEDERQPKKVNGPYPWNQGPNVPYKFPAPLDQQLTEKQKTRLKERLNKEKLTEDDISNGKFRNIPDDPNNRKCFYTELPTHLGNYEPHTKYATQVTGSQSDLFMTGPDGTPYAYYDGAVKVNGTAVNYGETEGAVTEVKTDQGWLIKVVNGIPLSSGEQKDWTELKIQLRYQADVARVCKLRYFIAFARQDVANIAGPMLVNMLAPHYPEIRVRHIPFN